MTAPRLLITSGEPAGIGIDICLQLANKACHAHIAVLADPDVMQQRAQQLGIQLTLHCLAKDELPPLHQQGHLCIIPLPVAAPVVAGKLDVKNAAYVVKMLDYAGKACIAQHYNAVVTAPVQKGIINDAGVAFSGHTEFFAELTNTQQVVMLLSTPQLNVALVTTHLPLRDISDAITPERLERVIRIVHHDFMHKFGLASPRILVCGLNPHAGEDGHLGREEIEVINPVLEKLRDEGMQLIGAEPADTLFTPQSLARGDVVLSMYHDQGLPVLKQQGFGEAVNITLGLPIIRTSVDHGTALSLAGTGKASGESLYCAIQSAISMVEVHKKNSLYT